MPKAKKSSPSPKIPPSDLDEFRAALADHTDWPAEEEKPVDETTPEPEAEEHEEVTPSETEEPSESVTTEVKSDAREETKKVAVSVDRSIGNVTPPSTRPNSGQVGRGAPSPTDMSKLDRAKGRHIPWGWIITIVTVLAAVAIVGFFVFNRAQRFAGTGVSLQISGQQQVASGSQIELTIRYFNSEPVDLVRSELAIEYPEGFQVTETSTAPSNEAKNSFPIGTIRNGRAGSLTVKGILVGPVGTKREFKAVLTYRPANFSSDFQTPATYAVDITSSILSLDVQGPDKLAPGAEGTWTLTYKNTSDRAQADIQVEAVYPEGLEITKVDPAATERSAIWKIDSLDPEADGKIKITGKATGTIGDSLELTFRIGLSSSNEFQLQDERTVLVILVNSGVKTTVAVNGQSENSTIEVGDDIQYAIRVANQSDNEVSDVKVTAKLTGAAANLQNVENPQKAKQSSDTFTWTKTEVPSLALIKPGNDVVIRLTVPTLPTLTVAKDTDVNPTVIATIESTSPSFDAQSSQGAKTSVTTKIATVMQLTAEARYYDDSSVAIGSGPIPPVVGETTAYRIRWALMNTTNELSNLTVSTVLPTHVFWTGKNTSRDAGDITFDATTRTVTWRLNKVPAGTGSRLPKLNAEFEISITPTSADVGQVVVLTNPSTAGATDSFTNRTREATQPSLTTDLPSDPKGNGQGAVQSAE